VSDKLWGPDHHSYNRAHFAAPWLTQSKIELTRFVSLLVLTFLLLSSLIKLGGRFFEFLTEWGVAMSFFTFLFLNINTVLTKKKGYPGLMDKDFVSHSKDHFIWRQATLMMELAITMEFVITLAFWLVLYPAINTSKRSEFSLFLMTSDHSVPLILLCLDMVLNSMRFKYSHFIVIVSVGSFYCFVNLLVTEISGHPVYFPMKWNNMGTIWFVGGSMVGFLMIFFPLCYLT
jgi:hypothetical protein